MRVLQLLAFGTLALGAQLPFLDLPVPEHDLSALSADDFTTFRHESYPKHGMRIKRIKDMCDNGSKMYTGYIDIDAHHLFFYFFESRSEPDVDPVLMWINGGPGCSSALGAFMELGPCNIHDGNGPKYNPYAWNTKANLFVLDQPINTGLSYADHGERVKSTEEAAVDVAALVNIFFQTFKQFSERPFFMAGESYGGRYLPVFASAVYDSKALAIAQGHKPINLKSVLIGNGATSFFALFPSYHTMACTSASGVGPVLPISMCNDMRKAVPRCEKMLKKSCIDTWDEISCTASFMFCWDTLATPFRSYPGANQYDLSAKCNGSIETNLCYPITEHITDYLNSPPVRSNLGISHKIGNFSSCSTTVGLDFGLKADMLRTSETWVAELLERGVKVLVYVGKYDWVCNWVGNLAWVSALPWSQAAEFNAKSLEEWQVDGERAGDFKTAGPLTFLTIEKAGHMAPYDRPVQSLEMLNRWLKGDIH